MKKHGSLLKIAIVVIVISAIFVNGCVMSDKEDVRDIEYHQQQAKKLYFQGNYTDCIIHSTQLIGLLDDKPEYHDLKGNYLNNLAKCYWKMNDYSKAVDYLSLVLSGEYADSVRMYSASTLANVYFHQSDYKKSLRYNFLALNIADSLSIATHKAKVLNDIGAVYQESGILNNAITYYKKSLISDSINDRVYYTYGNIGDCYLKMGDTDKAYYWYKKEYELIDTLNNIDFGMACLHLGEYYFEINNYYDSEIWLTKAAEHLTNHLDYLIDVYKYKKQLYAEKKDIQNVMYFSNAIDSLNELKVKKSNMRSIEIIENNIELNQNLKELETELLKKSYLSMIYNGILLSVGLIVIVSGLFLYRYLKVKRSADNLRSVYIDIYQDFVFVLRSALVKMGDSIYLLKDSDIAGTKYEKDIKESYENMAVKYRETVDKMRGN